MDVHGALDVLLRDPKPNHRTMINFYHSFSPEVERARRVFIFVYSRETSYQASRPVDQETSSNFPISKIQASKALSKDLYQQQKLAYLPLRARASKDHSAIMKPRKSVVFRGDVDDQATVMSAAPSVVAAATHARRRATRAQSRAALPPGCPK